MEELEPKIRQVQDMIPWVIVRLGVKDFCTRGAHGPLRLPAWSALPMPRDKEAIKDIRSKLAKAKEHLEARLSSPHRKLGIDDDRDDDIHAYGDLTADPAITVQFRGFNQLSFMGNAHTRHVLEPGATAFKHSEEVTMVLDPVEKSIRKHVPRLTPGCFQICADPPLQPRVKIYARMTPHELLVSHRKQRLAPNATEKEIARSLQWGEGEAARPAGVELSTMVNEMLTFDVEVDWDPLWMAPRCKACGTKRQGFCW